MDVVLVDSVNFAYDNVAPQLGLLSLYNQLKHRFYVEIVDFDNMYYLKEFEYDSDINVTIEKMARFLAEKDSSVYGFYTICNSYPITVLTAKKLKQLKPDARIIFGGPHATLTAHETLESFNFIDAIGLGEGETYICDLIYELISGRDNFKKLKGVCFRGKRGIESTEMPELLDVVELSNMNIVDMLRDSQYKGFRTEAFQLEGGRGCPFSCTFCSTNQFWMRKYRIRSVSSLIREMKGLYAEYGYKTFVFLHDIFTMDRDYLHEFCEELIREDMGFSWCCSSRIDNLSYDSIKLMKKAGCINIYVGLETGSERMQRKLRKNVNIADAIEKIIYIRSIGISITVSFIYGFPDETLVDFADSMRVIDELLINNIRSLQLRKLMPLPKTEELSKVIDKMYFDVMDIEFSIFKKSTNTQLITELIKQHPVIFSQFYTFESEVRSKYRRMDTMEYFLVTAFKEAPQTIRYSIKKHGIVGLYNLLNDEVETAYQDMSTLEIGADNEYWYLGPYRKTIRHLFSVLVMKLNEIDDDCYLKSVSIYELERINSVTDYSAKYYRIKKLFLSSEKSVKGYI